VPDGVDLHRVLVAFLAEANDKVRKVFHGPLTHASTPFEVVDWLT
jgi:hypothetical protein